MSDYSPPEADPRWDGFAGDFDQGVRGVSKLFRPTKEETEAAERKTAELMANMYMEHKAWFDVHYPALPGEEITEVFAQIQDVRDKIMEPWIKKMLLGTREEDVSKYRNIADIGSYAWDILVGDNNLELQIREALIDRRWVNTPMAEMATVAIFVAAEVLVTAFRRMCHYMVYNREHLVWEFHKLAGSIKPGDNS